MEPGLIILIVVAVVGVAIAAGYLSHKHEQERIALLAAFARERGWEFAPEKDRDFPHRFRQFEVFTRGHTRMAFNTMRGSISAWDTPCTIQTGDYRYSITTSNGKSTSTRVYRLSYLIAMLPFDRVPDVTIRPEGFLDSIAQAIGFNDIDFEDAEFSRKFMVKSRDKRFAYDLCDPRMIEHLKARYARGPAIVIADGAMCLWTDSNRWTPQEFAARADQLREFFAMWPEHLVRTLGGAPMGDHA